MLNKLFVNKRGEVRPGWKLATVLILYMMLSMLFGAGLQVFSVNESQYQMLGQYAGEAAFIIAVFIALKLLDGYSSRDIGLIGIQYAWKLFFIGLGLGAAAMTLIFFILYFSGIATLANGFAHPQFSWLLLNGVLFFFIVGVAEEYFFRGYLMSIFSRNGSRWVPVIFSSLLFAFAHALNPNVAVLGLVNIFIVGVLLAWMYLKTGNLWMPIGFHMAWNYFEGSVFGFPVSGTTPKGIYNINDAAHPLWSGGSFGPEAGLVVTLVLLALFFVLWKIPNQTRL